MSGLAQWTRPQSTGRAVLTTRHSHVDAPAREGALLGGLLILFLCRAMAAHMVVPPWQGPDEPSHVALAYLEAAPTAVEAGSVQAQILESMARHRWWEAYGRPTPDPLPTSFDVDGLGVGNLFQPLYYGLGGAVLRVTQPGHIEATYYHLRFLSVLFSVTTLALAWAGTRLLFGRTIALGSSMIAALNPQFALVAITVNPDALLNVCGAFVWWQVGRIAKGERRGLSLSLLLIGAAAALLTKRIGMTLVGLAAIVTTASLFASRTWRVTGRGAALAGIAMVVAVPVLIAGSFVFAQQFETLLEFWGNALTPRRRPDRIAPSDVLSYLRATVDHAWLIAGWLRFPAPEWWLRIVRIITVAGLVGAAVTLIESSSIRRRLSIAWLFLIAQVVAILGVTLWTIETTPQGRYLFPVIAPVTAVLYIGLTRAFPRAWRSCSPVMLLATFAIIDVIGFATVVIPAYI